ncbi:hypothetical protein BCR36DRAFT_247704, partial [Piromyces finnis]
MHIQHMNDVKQEKVIDPKECFTYCNKIISNCKVVEYHKSTNLCYFYDKIEDNTIFNQKIIKTSISKEECLNIFNNEPDSVFYKYEEKGEDIKCIIGILNETQIVEDKNIENSNDLKIPINAKFQIDETSKAGQTRAQKEGAKDNNGVPLFLVFAGITGVIIITGLIVYGIKMIKKANEKNSKNARNSRNQITYKIKATDHYNSRYVFGNNSGSKNSTLNNSNEGKSYTSQHSHSSRNHSTNRSQHSTISNIAPYDYSYNDTNITYINSSIQNTTLQDFYNNASLSYSTSPQRNNFDFFTNASYGSSPQRNNLDFYSNA